MKQFLSTCYEAIIVGAALPFLLAWKVLEALFYGVCFFAPIVGLIFLIEWGLKWIK